MPTEYRGGYFEVPAAPGTVTVSGLDVTPDAVVFIGSNSTTLDTVLTGDNLGLFMGYASYDIVAGGGTLVGHSQSLLPEIGRYIMPKPIMCSATVNTTAYEADIVSFNADGFTVNFTKVAAGIVAWMVVSSEGYAGSLTRFQSSATTTVGFQGRCSLLLDARDSDNTGPDVAGNFHHVCYGGGTYQDASGDVRGAFMSQIRGNLNRHEVNTFVVELPPAFIGEGGGYVGPFLNTGWIYGKPTSLTDYYFSVRSQNTGNVLIWNDTGYSDFGALAATVGATQLNTLPFDQARAAVFYSIADSPSNSNAPSSICMLGLACLNADEALFQYGVFKDGVAAPKTFYQSLAGIPVDIDAGSTIQVVEPVFDPGVANRLGFETLINTIGGTPPSLLYHAYIGVPKTLEVSFDPLHTGRPVGTQVTVRGGFGNPA